MSLFEDKLKEYLRTFAVQAEHLSLDDSCHSVEEAARTVGASPDEFVKSICLISKDSLIVAIVKGEDRVSIPRVAEALNISKPRMATPEEILQKTGYPCGGTPPLGFEAVFLIDSQILEKETVYAGGGSETSLLKIATEEMAKANSGQVTNIRK